MKRKNFCITLPVVLLIAILTVMPASTKENQENLAIEVPGGIKLLGTVIGINSIPGRDFVWVLTNYLCKDIAIINKSESETKRNPLLLYLDYIEAATAFMQRDQNGYTATLSLRNKEIKEKTEKLLRIFGYQLITNNGDCQIVSNEDKNNWQKHLTFRLLSYSPEILASKLSKSEEIKLIIPVENITLPFSASLIARIIPYEKDLSKHFLKIVAENVNFSYLLLGLYNLNEKTIDTIETSNDNANLSGWRALLTSSDYAGWEFYKILPCLDTQSTTIKTPIDRELLKGASGYYFNENTFIKSWMHNADGKFAYFMRGLNELNPKVKSIILNIDEKKLKKEINLLYLNLPIPEKERLSHLYDLKELGEFPEVMRILRAQGNELYFPGNYNSWLIAAQNNSMPENPDQLATEISISPRLLDYLEYFKLLSKYHSEVGGYHYNGFNIFFRLYNFFSGKPELATPENIVMLFRAYPYYPAIMNYLENIKFNDPVLVQKLIFKINELEKINNDSYETTIRIFQSTLSLLWLLSDNKSFESQDIEKIFHSFLDIPVDKRYGYQFNYIQWFIQKFLGAIHCSISNASSCLVDILVNPIPQQKMELASTIFSYDPRTREKERIELILKKQKIPPIEFILSGSQILTASLSSESAEPIKNAIITMKDLLKNPANSPQHQVDAEIMNLFNIMDQLLLNNIHNKDTLSAGIITSLNNLIGYYQLGLVYSYWMNNPESPAYKDNQFIVKHDFSKLVTTILIRTPWRNSHLVFQDPEKGIYIESSLSTLPIELVPLITQTEASVANSRILNDELGKWLWAAAIFPEWDFIDEESNNAVAFTYLLGKDILLLMQNRKSPAAFLSKEDDLEPWFSFIGKPRAIIIQQCSSHDSVPESYHCDDISFYFTPSEILNIGKYVIENQIRINSSNYDAMQELLSKDPHLHARMNQYGTLSSHINGFGRMSIHSYPSYENLDRYYTHIPIAQRLFDYKIQIAVLMHKQKLPAILQYNLWQKAVLYILSHARQNYYDDLEPIIWQVSQINEDTVQRWIQELKAQGYLELE